MSSLICRVAALAIYIAGTQSIGAVAQPVGSAPAVTGTWGFDLSGADFAKRPGDDFYRYANGAWYDRTVIPPDRSSNGVTTALDICHSAYVMDMGRIVRTGLGAELLADPIIRDAYLGVLED